MIAHMLGLTRMQIYLEFERILSDSEMNALREMVKRRGKYEPLQHIIGEVDFHGLQVKTTKDALIPRPETEAFVEFILANTELGRTKRVYDVGTGSGVIALALAHEWKECEIIAIDIDDKALNLARENHRTYEHLNITWREGNLLQNITENADVVVANLPYLTTDEMHSLSHEVQCDPARALDGGSNGLDFIAPLIEQSASIAPQLFLETGIGHVCEVESLLKKVGYRHTRVEEDLTGRERFVMGAM